MFSVTPPYLLPAGAAGFPHSGSSDPHGTLAALVLASAALLLFAVNHDAQRIRAINRGKSRCNYCRSFATLEGSE
jgi:hypothetical protein